MAPLKISSKAPLSTINGIFTNGINTRSKNNTKNTNIAKDNVKAVGKRKAGSPLKETTAKRAAFGDITNSISKAILNDKNKNVINKVTIEAKNLPTLKVVKHKNQENILIPPSLKEKPQKVTRNSVGKNVALKEVSKKVLPPPEVSKGPITKTELPGRIHRSRDYDKENQGTKPALPTTRLSDEFSEASLYVSAVEDLSTINTTSTEKLKDKRSILKKRDIVEHIVPSGVNDFDKANWNDPFQVSHYAMDIFNYLKERERLFPIPDYMAHQKSLTAGMRSLLIDWMVEVQESFELNHETLYLAVKLVDLYLCKEATCKEQLQLLGAASLFIASKFDERIPPLVDDFLYICDGAYTLKQLLKMEINVLKSVDFDLGIPLSYRFLRRYARCSCVSMPTLTLARFILELCLMEYAVLSFSDSKMAAAALYLALRMKNLGEWTDTHAYYTGYSLEEILPIAKIQNMCLHKKPKEALSTVRNKYSHKIFFEVAKVPLVTNETLSSP